MILELFEVHTRDVGAIIFLAIIWQFGNSDGHFSEIARSLKIFPWWGAVIWKHHAILVSREVHSRIDTCCSENKRTNLGDISTLLWRSQQYSQYWFKYYRNTLSQPQHRLLDSLSLMNWKPSRSTHFLVNILVRRSLHSF